MKNWEIHTARECLDILNFLIQGAFADPKQIADRLRNTADSIEAIAQRKEEK